jgi:hypothetical protein
MSAVRRKLLVCLLMLALPVQATLAASQAFCMAHPHGHTAMQSSVVATPAGMNVHHDACAHAATDDGGSAPVAPQADAAPAADGSCNACAACCAPGAVQALARGLPLAVPVPAAFGAVDAAVEAFASDGPDRPPRSALG